jgi:NADPH-dependent 2,4-dienoyl-CoA reductase/sulfur reductase-like enzyme
MSARRVPLAVVGAGPAGIAATAAAVGAGVPVLLVDPAPRAGGQYHRREPAAFRARDPHALTPSGRGWHARTARLLDDPRVTHLAGATVWAAQRRDGATVLATDHADAPEVVADAVVLATGAHERVLPFPGWDLPGVLTIGGAQALLKGQGVLPGREVVVAGAGPLLLPVSAALARAGAGLVAVCDAGDPLRWLAGGPRGLPAGKVAEAAAWVATLARHGHTVRPRTAAVRARGDGRVEEVELARLDARWRVVPGSERWVAADALVTSHGFVPDVALALTLGCRLTGPASAPTPSVPTSPTPPAVAVDAYQATGVPGVWAAGEVTGIGGADVAAHEGTTAGLAAARAAGGEVDDDALERAAARRRGDRAFLAALTAVLELPDGWLRWLEPDTVVCRCEEVPLGRIDDAIAHRDARDLRSVKLTTRCGMGRCQARMCGANVAAILAARTGAPPTDAGALERRPVLTPVALGRLGGR